MGGPNNVQTTGRCMRLSSFMACFLKSSINYLGFWVILSLQAIFVCNRRSSKRRKSIGIALSGTDNTARCLPLGLLHHAGTPALPTSADCNDVLAPESLSLLCRALFHCNYCNKDISNTIRVKCAVCPDFDLCLECFSVGVEIHPHRRSHAYRVVDNLSFPLFTPDWGVCTYMTSVYGPA